MGPPAPAEAFGRPRLLDVVFHQVNEVVPRLETSRAPPAISLRQQPQVGSHADIQMESSVLIR